MENLKLFLDRNKIVIEKISIIVLFFSGMYIFFKYIFVLIAPFIIGYIIASFLEPVVRLLMHKFRLNRSISAIISIILMIILIGGSLFLIISQIVQQGMSLYQYNHSQIFDKTNEAWNMITSLVSNLFFYIPENNKEMVHSFFQNVVSSVTTFAGEKLKVFGVAFIKFVPKLFVYTLVGLLSSFFFIKDRALIRNVYRENVPNVIKKNFIDIKTGLSSAFLGYLKSQSIIMCVTATICLTGLIILRNQYAFLLAFLIAIVDVLPLFGSGFILWPLSFISFVNGDIKTGIGALIMYATVQITRQIIEPKILGSQIGLHPLITLMSIYVGLIVFGVLGIVLGPMSVIIIKTIWNKKT